MPVKRPSADKFNVISILDTPRYSNISVDDLMFTMRVMIKLDSAHDRASQLIKIQEILTANGVSSTDLVDLALEVPR